MKLRLTVDNSPELRQLYSVPSQRNCLVPETPQLGLLHCGDFSSFTPHHILDLFSRILSIRDPSRKKLIVMPADDTSKVFGALEYGLLLIFVLGTCVILLSVWLHRLIPSFPEYIGRDPPYASWRSASTDM